MLKRLWHTFKRRSLMGASVIFLVSNIIVVWFAGVESGAVQASYSTAEKMRDTTRSLLIGVLNAETGARGYTITGNGLYLAPYFVGVQSVSDQMRILRLLHLDEIQRAEVVELASLTEKQMEQLASLVDQMRTQGGDTAGARFKTGADKVGLDSLRSFIDRTTGDLSESMVLLQRNSRNYLDITAYCVLFGAFWIYVIILLAARQPHGEGQ
jgi:CHASE3 domain sensor protein